MKKLFTLVLVVLLTCSFAATSTMATPTKAKQTGKSCDECHKGNKVGPHGKKDK